MSKFETPIDFEVSKQIENVHIIHSNLMEIAQGGPVVGNLSINNTLINNIRFGGPILFQKEYVYLPVFIRKLCISGFRLCQINVKSLEIQYIGKVKELIFLDRIEDNRIYFFEDLNKKKSNHLIIHTSE